MSNLLEATAAGNACRRISCYRGIGGSGGGPPTLTGLGGAAEAVGIGAGPAVADGAVGAVGGELITGGKGGMGAPPGAVAGTIAATPANIWSTGLGPVVFPI